MTLKIMLALLGLSAWLAADCTAAAQIAGDEQEVVEAINRECIEKTLNSNTASGPNYVCLNGQINLKMRDDFMRLVNKETKFVHISSQGGSVYAAIEIATEMYERRQNIIMYKSCFSSCANYLFLAAADKYIIDKAIVGWHGTAGSMTDDWEKVDNVRRTAHDVDVKKEREFFSLIKSTGVTDEVAITPPPKLKAGAFGWGYSDEQLLSRFHIANIKRVYVNPRTSGLGSVR